MYIVFEKLDEILIMVQTISEQIEPNIVHSLAGLLAPFFSTLVAVLIAYWLDRRVEIRRDNESLLGNINYILVKNDLNIRSLFSINRNAESGKVKEAHAGTHVEIPQVKIFSPLIELELSELRLVNIDNIVTNLIFEFRELNQILTNDINRYNSQADLLVDLSKKEKITIHHFKKYNLLLDKIIESANAFIIRLIVLNTQLLSRAYIKLKSSDWENLYEMEITTDLVKFIECKKDHPDVKTKYDKIHSLKSKNRLEKSFKGMERKDTLIRIFLKIMESTKS